MKPFYEDDLVTLYHGDCRDVLDRIVEPRSVVITDPPYGFRAYATDRDATDVLRSLTSMAKTVAVFGYPELLARWCAGVEPTEWVTWWPTNKQTGRAALLPRESEHVAIFGEVPGARRLMRPRSDKEVGRQIAELRGNDATEARMGDVWRDPSPGAGFNAHQRLHPNEKPLSVMRRLVQLCSNPGDVVVDPFAGSGTTLRAAKDLGRRAVGIEIDEGHCKTAAERLGQDVFDFGEAA